MEITCGVYLLDKNNNILICKAFGGNNWSIPKGVVEPNEHYFGAAIRELEEETNVKYFETKFKFAEILPDSIYKNRKKTLKSLVLKTDNEQSDFQLKCNSFFEKDGVQYPENSEYLWVTLDEAKNYLHESQIANLEIIKEYLILTKKWHKFVINSTYGVNLI